MKATTAIAAPIAPRSRRVGHSEGMGTCVEPPVVVCCDSAVVTVSVGVRSGGLVEPGTHPSFIAWQGPVVELEAAGALVGEVCEMAAMTCLEHELRKSQSHDGGREDTSRIRCPRQHERASTPSFCQSSLSVSRKHDRVENGKVDDGFAVAQICCLPSLSRRGLVRHQSYRNGGIIAKFGG
jgi:hypothetical protein